MPKRKENKEKKVYFSPDEWHTVCKKAAAVNMRTGTYIRNIAVKGSIRKVDLKQLNHLLLAFHRIGIEMNQVAKVVNSTQSVFKKDIEEMQESFSYLKDVFSDYLLPLKSDEILTGDKDAGG